MTSDPRDSNDRTGRFYGIHFENIKATSENGGLISGRTHGEGVSNLTMKNIQITIRTFSNFSDGSGPPCSFIDRSLNFTFIVPMHCMGSRDYRPSMIQGDDPDCLTWGSCRTPSVANGLYAENIHTSSFENMKIFFQGSRRLWYGECLVFDKTSSNLRIRNVACNHDPTS